MPPFRTVAVVLAFVPALALAGCGNGPPGSPGGVAAGGPSIGTGAVSGLGTPVVTVNEDDAQTFKPDTTSLKVGDVIQWTNGGGQAHNVTFDSTDVTSGSQNQGDTWQVKFSVAGTYTYYCTFHSDGTTGMVGKVTVTGTAASSPSTSPGAATPGASGTPAAETPGTSSTPAAFPQPT